MHRDSRGRLKTSHRSNSCFRRRTFGTTVMPEDRSAMSQWSYYRRFGVPKRRRRASGSPGGRVTPNSSWAQSSRAKKSPEVPLYHGPGRRSARVTHHQWTQRAGDQCNPTRHSSDSFGSAASIRLGFGSLRVVGPKQLACPPGRRQAGPCRRAQPGLKVFTARRLVVQNVTPPPHHATAAAAPPRPAPPLARAACFSTSRSGSRAAPRWRRAEYEKCGGQWSRAAPRGRRVGYEKHDWLCTAAVNGVVWWGEARLSGRRRTSGNRSFRQGPPLAGVLPTRALQSQGTSTPGICICVLLSVPTVGCRVFEFAAGIRGLAEVSDVS